LPNLAKTYANRGKNRCHYLDAAPQNKYGNFRHCLKFLGGEAELARRFAVNKFIAIISVAGTLMLAASSMAMAGKAADAMKVLDPDHDGTIDLKEAEAGAYKVFHAINPDKDGTVDKKELSGRVSEGALKKADPDSDGTLDWAEYKALVAERFAKANPDNDGTVDEKELKTPAGKKLLKLIY
jgi:Ca2+-binding EF-hand superfamily protein